MGRSARLAATRVGPNAMAIAIVALADGALARATRVVENVEPIAQCAVIRAIAAVRLAHRHVRFAAVEREVVAIRRAIGALGDAADASVARVIDDLRPIAARAVRRDGAARHDRFAAIRVNAIAVEVAWRASTHRAIRARASIRRHVRPVVVVAIVAAAAAVVPEGRKIRLQKTRKSKGCEGA
jgi:hypothetical protein